MTRGTQCLFVHRFVTVPAQKAFIVPKETDGQSVLESAALVAGSALPSVPLLFVFVTVEALTHGRDGRLPLSNHPGMAYNALALDFLHREVQVVVEADAAVGTRWHHIEHVRHPFQVVVVAARAQFGVRQLVGSATLARSMAGVAGQASGLPRPTAAKLGEVLCVGKARFSLFRAGCQQSGCQQRGHQHPQA
jgi:hypothetical protein